MDKEIGIYTLLSILLFLTYNQSYSFIYLAEVLKTVSENGDHYIYLFGDFHEDDFIPFYELSLVNELNSEHYKLGQEIHSINAFQVFKLFQEIKKRADALLIIEDMNEDTKSFYKDKFEDDLSELNKKFLFKMGEICKSHLPIINVEFRYIYAALEIIEKNEKRKIFIQEEIKNLTSTINTINKRIIDCKKSKEKIEKLEFYQIPLSQNVRSHQVKYFNQLINDWTKHVEKYTDEIKKLEIEINKLKDEEKVDITIRKIIFQDMFKKMKEVSYYNDCDELNSYYKEGLNDILKALDNVEEANLSNKLCHNITCDLIDLKIVHHIFQNNNRKNIFVCAGGGHIENVSKVLQEKLGYQSIKSIKNNPGLKKPINLESFFEQLSTEKDTKNSKKDFPGKITSML